MKNVSKLTVMEEAYCCLLCYDAPCSKACPAQSNPSEFLKSLRFQNPNGAVINMRKNNFLSTACAELCNGKKYCEKVCVRNKIDSPIEIQKVHQYLSKQPIPQYCRKSNHIRIACFADSISELIFGLCFFLNGYEVTLFLNKPITEYIASGFIKDVEELIREGLMVEYNCISLDTSSFSYFIGKGPDYASDVVQISLPVSPERDFIRLFSFIKRYAARIQKEMEEKI